MIYGVDFDLADKIRDKESKQGLLRVGSDPHFLPKRKDLGIPAHHGESGEDFLSGDTRCMVHSTVLSTHILWLNEHNRIANGISKVLRSKLPTQLPPDHFDELIFQETRKIVIAELQAITYNEWLPAIFGQEVIDKHNLRLRRNSNYNPEVDPTLKNEFAASAYRFGHSLVQVQNRQWLSNLQFCTTSP